MEAVVVRVVVALVLSVAGLVFGKGDFARVVSKAIMFLLLYFSLPILTWYTVGIALPRSFELVDIVVVGFTYTALALVVVVFLTSFAGKRLGWSCRVEAATTLASVFQNALFLPLPIVLLLGGVVEFVVAYGISFNTAVGVAVPFIVSRCGVASRFTVLGFLRGLFAFPPFYGLLAGLATMPLSWQVWSACGHVVALLKSVASEMTILSFYLAGASIASTWPPKIDSAVGFITAWRLAISPLIHAGIAMLLGLDGWLLKCALIESFMPPATMNLVFSEYYRLETSVIASSIALVTPLSLALVGLLAVLGW